MSAARALLGAAYVRPEVPRVDASGTVDLYLSASWTITGAFPKITPPASPIFLHSPARPSQADDAPTEFGVIVSSTPAAKLARLAANARGSDAENILGLWRAVLRANTNEALAAILSRASHVLQCTFVAEWPKFRGCSAFYEARIVLDKNQRPLDLGGEVEPVPIRGIPTQEFWDSLSGSHDERAEISRQAFRAVESMVWGLLLALVDEPFAPERPEAM